MKGSCLFNLTLLDTIRVDVGFHFS